MDAFNLGFEVFRTGNGRLSVKGVMEFMKWSFLGVYLGLESLTIVCIPLSPPPFTYLILLAW